MTKDPVCGMTIDETTAGASATYQGHTYYFCSDSCKAKFQKDPKRYSASEHAGHQH